MKTEAKKLSYYKKAWLKLSIKKELSGENALAAVQKNGYVLQYVHNPSEAVALAAVKRNGDALRYVPNPSEAVALAAVKQDGYALQYVPAELFND